MYQDIYIKTNIIYEFKINSIEEKHNCIVLQSVNYETSFSELLYFWGRPCLIQVNKPKLAILMTRLRLRRKLYRLKMKLDSISTNPQN